MKGVLVRKIVARRRHIMTALSVVKKNERDCTRNGKKNFHEDYRVRGTFFLILQFSLQQLVF